MKPTLENENKAIVLEAFDTLFNRRDYAAAEKFWLSNCATYVLNLHQSQAVVTDQIDTGQPEHLRRTFHSP